MMRKFFLAVLAATWFTMSASAIAAQQNVTPSLWMAKTSGTWKEGKRYGFYRAVVYRSGGEHARDFVEIHIIESNSESGEKTVIKTISIDAPGYQGYIKDVSLASIDDQHIAVALDIEMKGMGGIVLREVYLVSPNGKIRNLAKATYQDIHE